jgi:hypothetical protein
MRSLNLLEEGSAALLMYKIRFLSYRGRKPWMLNSSGELIASAFPSQIADLGEMDHEQKHVCDAN